MKYIYKITGKVSLILYIFMLYQFWHLCQYGGLRRHIPMLALGIIGLVGTVVLWLISKRHNQEVNSGDNGNKKLFYTEMILLIAATLFFGGRIVYSAVPYHGALSWKLDEWMRKKEVELEHNNLFEDGVEGILMDLDEALQLPEELYIANKYQVSFDENGTIQRIYAFIYGKNEAGEKKTYLIDYDADSSNDMTVWIDSNVNGEYSDDMRLSPMIEILNNSDWTSQVEAWAETFEEQQIYEILYMGRRSFSSEEGLQYISGDADGDGTETGTGNFTQLRSGGEIVGFEVSLHIPDLNSVTPVRYMGFTVVPFGQGYKDMSPPTKELMKLTLEERIAHGGHKVLRWMMDNVYVRQDPAGNIKMDKEKSTEKIDAAVATVMALDRAIRNQGSDGSVYDARGILVF